MMIYGSAGNEKDIKVLLKSHMEQSHYRDTYMKQVKYNKEAVAGDKKKQERELQKRMEEAFKEHLNCWKSAEIVDFFALASVFNVQVFVVSPYGVTHQDCIFQSVEIICIHSTHPSFLNGRQTNNCLTSSLNV